MQDPLNLLFVCMGNICRSPTAHAIMQTKIDVYGLQGVVSVDSAGTHAYHVGEQSDARSRQTAQARGIDMEHLRARKISINDYDHFDYIYAMDEANLELVQYYAPSQPKAQIELFLAPANRARASNRREVPDPYHGGEAGFTDVFTLLDVGCEAILSELGLH